VAPCFATAAAFSAVLASAFVMVVTGKSFLLPDPTHDDSSPVALKRTEKVALSAGNLEEADDWRWPSSADRK